MFAPTYQESVSASSVASMASTPDVDVIAVESLEVLAVEDEAPCPDVIARHQLS
jgi:hypothetical protein